MIDFDDVAPLSTITEPATRDEARARLIAIDDAIAAIRTQIAAADMKRQARGKGLDPDWFHRARTALRHLQRERAEVQQRMATLPGGRERLKDRIIAVLRAEYDDEGWNRVLAAARRLDGELG